MRTYWIRKALGELAHFKSGGTPSTENSSYWGGITPWVTAKDMKSPIILDSALRLTENGKASAKLAPEGALLVLVRGMTLHKDVPICLAGKGVAFNQDVKALVTSGEILPQYLMYFLHSQKSKLLRMVDTAGHGTGRLDSELLKSFPILVPPLEVQESIASILPIWDQAIEKTKKLVETREKRNQWLIIQLYQPYPNVKEQTFGDFLYESTIPGSHGATAKKLTIKLYGKGVVPKEEKRKGSQNTQYYRRRAGQLVYSKLDFLNGAFGIIPEDLDGYETTQDLPAFDISPEINPEWLLGYLTRPVYYKHQVGLARGQRKARRVNPRNFLNSTLFVPPRGEQDKVAEILQTAQQDLEKTRLLREKLILQKRGLMQKLLTGEWRVNTAKERNLLDPPHPNLLPQGREGTKSKGVESTESLFLPPRPHGRRGLG